MHFLLIVINFTSCKSLNTNNSVDVNVDSDGQSNEDNNENFDEQSTDISEDNLTPLEEATPEQLSFINLNKNINGQKIMG